MPNSSPPPAPDADLALDATAIDRALKRIAHEIIEAHPDLAAIAVAGIPTRGVVVAGRLARYVHEFSGVPVETGVVDISMHRDDLHRRPRITEVVPTQLPAELSGRTIILADDVLYSGRTIRAAMDAIASFGRPARIQLAVLIDRGHRELPIRPDFVGRNLPTASSQRVYVRFRESDGVNDSVWMQKP